VTLTAEQRRRFADLVRTPEHRLVAHWGELVAATPRGRLVEAERARSRARVGSSSTGGPPILKIGDAVAARLSLVDQTRQVTAASELARNTLQHGGGRVEVTTVDNGRRRGVRLSFADSGPAIADLDLALTDGYTTAGGSGLGLSGARRLVDDFEVDTRPGRYPGDGRHVVAVTGVVGWR